MQAIYYYLILLGAVVTFAAAGLVYWRNRTQEVGPVLGTALFFKALWLISFAQYLLPIGEPRGLLWGRVTLALALTSQPLLFHCLCAAVNKSRRYRWWIITSYLLGLAFLILLIQGQVVEGLKHSSYLDHYLRYNRRLYPVLMTHMVVWQSLGAVILVHTAWRSVGYMRSQLMYFSLAWFNEFLIVNSIVLPLEYNINVQPFGFFVLPLNMAFLAYVMGKARMADYNVVIARVLLYTVTLLVLVGVSLAFVGGMMVVAPGFMNQQQMIFSVILAGTIGFGLTISLPRLLPRAERIMQEQFFGGRSAYQHALGRLVKQLNQLPSLDEMLGVVVSEVHTRMQVARVLILLRDALSGRYRIAAQSGLTAEEAMQTHELGETSAVVEWLQQRRDALVRDELPRRVDAPTLAALTAEMDLFKVTLGVPMVLDGRMVGMVLLGEKSNREMFFVSDLGLLETLATEVAMAIRYRRMEEEISRKNKLVELGTIAAGVAHEIRNPLASIKTFAQLLPEKMDDQDFRNEFAQLVLKDVDRITKVVESMLAFARPGQVTVAVHPVTELVEEAVLLTQARLKNKRIELTRQFHEEPVLKVDKQQILQVLINLINNAADALPEHGKIRITTRAHWIEGMDDGQRSRRFSVIEVSDNGPGISAALRNRLFDPFFTTKKDGTGLGLSISQKIVRDHGGVITVSSVEGKGASFQINLPLG